MTANMVGGRNSRFAAVSLPRALAAAVLWLVLASTIGAQDIVLPGGEPAVMDGGGAPVTEFGGGSFFSQDLGTILRLRYNTESYGQDHHGNFDIGTMQVLTLDDAAAFFDGQITMNDQQGVGYNLGAGYRWMHFPMFSPDTGRIEGVSLWTDGTSTGEGGFFPQLGLSWESLGDVWDFRTNGYLPLGPQDQMGEFTPTGETSFFGNSIAELTQAVVDSSYAVAEAEAARRLGSERDAWAFAGPYFLANDDDDAAGFRVGVRGYAYPDLFVQVAVSDDEIFKTNASFSVVWFVGRTRTDYQPACGVPDRFREPVLRNDYVVLSQSFVQSGVPLTQPDGSALHIVHVDSTAAPGGDGTFENPFDMISDANGAGSLEGDIILAHALSDFTGDGSTTLKVDQRLLGEGDGFVHTVVTAEQGSLEIPETAPGARDFARPVVNATLADAIILANNNEVANFDFQDVNGNAIFGTGLTGNANLHDLAVMNGTDFAISLVDIATTSVVTLDEFTYDGGAGAAGGIELVNFDGTFTASDGTLTNGTQAGIRIAANGADDSDGTFTFASTFTIDSVDNAGGAAFEIDGFTGVSTMNGTIDNDIGQAVSIQNMDTGAVVTFSATADITHNTTGANSEGVFIADNTDGTIAFNGDLILTTNGSIAFDANEAGNVVALTAPSANNSIDTTGAIGLRIVGAEIGAAGVNFPTLNASGGANGVLLMDNTVGPIIVGTLGDAAPDSGVIAATGDAIVIDNSANVTVSGIQIDNPAAASGVVVNKDTTGTQTTNLNDLEINNGAFGVKVTGNGTGTLNMTVNDTTINDPTAFGLSVDNIDSGTIRVSSATIDGDPANAGAVGVRIRDSNATFTFDVTPAADDTLIQNFAGTDFEVDGGTPNLTFNGEIVNTDVSGRSVVVHNITGGSVTFSPTSSITDENQGMLVEDNSGGIISFLGTNNLDTAGTDVAVTVKDNLGTTDVIFDNLDITTVNGDGVFISNNASTASVSISDVDVTSTGTGRGFVAMGGGDLTVSGNNNVIKADTGVGLTIDGMNIFSQATFESVTVDGAANGIVLTDVTGAQVTVGEAGNAPDSGGSLTTANEAIVLENVANADFLHVHVVSAGGPAANIDHTNTATNAMDVTFNDLNLDASTGLGIDVDAASSQTFNLRLQNSFIDERVVMDNTGSGAFRVLVDNTDITTAGADVALAITFSGSTADGDVTIQNGSTLLAVNARALDMAVNGAGASVEIKLDASTFTSTTAEDVSIVNNVGSTTNANITNNTFANSAAADDVVIRSDGAAGVGTRLNLNLVNNGLATSTISLVTANNGGGFNFGVVARDTTDANNPANVTFTPIIITDFESILGPVEMPTVP